MAVQNLKIALALRHQTNLYVKHGHGRGHPRRYVHQNSCDTS